MNISNLPKLSDFVDTKGRIIPYNDDPGAKKYFLQLSNINGNTVTEKITSLPGEFYVCCRELGNEFGDVWPKPVHKSILALFSAR